MIQPCDQRSYISEHFQISKATLLFLHVCKGRMTRSQTHLFIQLMWNKCSCPVICQCSGLLLLRWVQGQLELLGTQARMGLIMSSRYAPRVSKTSAKFWGVEFGQRVREPTIYVSWHFTWTYFLIVVFNKQTVWVWPHSEASMLGSDGSLCLADYSRNTELFRFNSEWTINNEKIRDKVCERLSCSDHILILTFVFIEFAFKTVIL